jgi:glutathione S-transferase
MAPETLITLYDVPSDVSGKAWSPNMWKARCVLLIKYLACKFTQHYSGLRYVLNHKGIPYKTTWLEYPEIEPTMRSIGALPTSTKTDGSPYYSLPTIVDPSRRTSSGGPTVVSESFLIAEYLDEAYPTPDPLFPEGTKALQKQFYDHFFTTAMRPIMPILLTEMFGHLNDGSQP